MYIDIYYFHFGWKGGHSETLIYDFIPKLNEMLSESYYPNDVTDNFLQENQWFCLNLKIQYQ